MTERTYWRKDNGTKRTEVQIIPDDSGTVCIPAKDLYYLLRKGGYTKITLQMWTEGEIDDDR
jgi:hypothetical protein